VGAAYELQSRLYNILRRNFLQKYHLGSDEAQKDDALQNTLYVVGQNPARGSEDDHGPRDLARLHRRERVV
jgi:hypothetical protein